MAAQAPFQQQEDPQAPLETEEAMIVGFIPAPKGASIAAHDAGQEHKYVMHFPEHLPREEDPHYKAFNAYHRTTESRASCYVGLRAGLASCAIVAPLELHHAMIEFSLANGVSLAALQIDFPDLKDDAAVQKWIESDKNFRWLCQFHHRGHGGAHTAAHADWEAQLYVPKLLSVKTPTMPPTTKEEGP
jgi:hypothetical protein